MALRAVIVGGGIGGIVTAVALVRAGVDVQMYEQAQQLAEVGAGVSLAPNGLRMLERLGVGEGIERMGARYVSAQLRLSNGRAVRHEPYQFTQPGQHVGIHRADLLALVAGQLPPDTVRTGHRCPGLGEDSGSATVDYGLAAGGSAGAVIGAVTGHVKGGLDDADLKQLGEVLGKGQAGLIAVYAVNMADQIVASIKAQNRYVSKEIEANADELAKQLKAAEGS